MTPTSDQDRASVAAQLGRPPRGRWSVARRCACGKPQVLETFPRLGDGTPFPTLYWLSCRKLSSQIGGLESSGWMAALNRRLAEEPELHAALAEATRAYVRRRDQLDELGPATHPGGGPDRIKCLHAHTAQFLVTGDNPAGEEVLKALSWKDPVEPCV
ncbi:MAG TPA: DUF501 domain-containing protein [Actinomycetota bacterium]|nr:DUF501 domain-containing protein [Actinomycetota bacterium]